MVRKALLATTLALCPPAAGHAEMINVDTELRVDAAAGPRKDPVVRGRVEGSARRLSTGIRAATPADQEPADVDLYRGMRPQWRAVSGDLDYTRSLQGDCCGELGLSLGRSFGPRADLGARVYFVPATETGGPEARASVTVFRGYRIGGGLTARAIGDHPEYAMDVGPSRTFAEACDIGQRYENASYRRGRAEMSVEMKF